MSVSTSARIHSHTRTHTPGWGWAPYVSYMRWCYEGLLENQLRHQPNLVPILAYFGLKVCVCVCVRACVFGGGQLCVSHSNWWVFMTNPVGANGPDGLYVLRNHTTDSYTRPLSPLPQPGLRWQALGAQLVFLVLFCLLVRSPIQPKLPRSAESPVLVRPPPRVHTSLASRPTHRFLRVIAVSLPGPAGAAAAQVSAGGGDGAQAIKE
jgi:hypothetical protein